MNYRSLKFAGLCGYHLSPNVDIMIITCLFLRLWWYDMIWYLCHWWPICTILVFRLLWLWRLDLFFLIASFVHSLRMNGLNGYQVYGTLRLVSQSYCSSNGNGAVACMSQCAWCERARAYLIFPAIYECPVAKLSCLMWLVCLDLLTTTNESHLAINHLQKQQGSQFKFRLPKSCVSRSTCRSISEGVLWGFSNSSVTVLLSNQIGYMTAE